MVYTDGKMDPPPTKDAPETPDFDFDPGPPARDAREPYEGKRRVKRDAPRIAPIATSVMAPHFTYGGYSGANPKDK